MTASPGAAMTMNSVSKWYRSRVLALQDVSAVIPVGARVGLLGPNGAGKSTVVKLLHGTLRPTTGRVQVLGVDAGASSFIDVRRRMGVVPQSAGVYSDLTGGEYLDLARAAYGQGDLTAVIDRFGLGAHLQKSMSKLSGGLQRRVSLAAALVAEPEILIMDEPSLGLDPVAAEEMYGYLRDISPGRTVLVCTNNIAEAEALCDHVVILKDGRVVLHGPLDGLRGQRSQVVIRATQPRDSLLAHLAGLGIAARAEENGVLIDLEDGARYDEAVPKILRSLLDSGFDVVECRPLESMLKTAFFDAVQGLAP